MVIAHVCLCNEYTDGWNYQENILAKYHVVLGYKTYMIASKWALNNDGKSVYVNTERYVDSNGVHVVRLPIKNNKKINCRYKKYIGLEQVLEILCPDIIFIHNLQFFDIKTIAHYAQNHKVVIYADNHADFSNSAKTIVSKLIYKIIWRYYAGIINPYVSKFYGVLPSRVDFLIQMFGLPESKCELLVMGADDDLVIKADNLIFQNKIRQHYGILEDDFLIMSCGKFDSWKKQTLLLMKAVKKINDKKVKLLVFGSVSDDIKKDFLDLCDNQKIIYAGWIQPDLSYFYVAAADLFVFPGRHSVFWEQVCGQGKPMVIKYWPGTNDVDLGGNVRFLYEDSVDEIYKILCCIIDDKLVYNRMKKVANTKGRQVFSYKNIAKRSLKM